MFLTIYLIFFQEYLSLKRYPFQRLDGSVSADRRKQSIAAFNDEKSLDFCFLLSTKAGGLGINLQTANRYLTLDIEIVIFTSYYRQLSADIKIENY